MARPWSEAGVSEVGPAVFRSPSLEEIAEEQGRVDRLRRLSDVTCALLRQATLSRGEALALVEQARGEALNLFPDKGDVFDLVLAPRFQRIVDEVAPAARVLPFRRL